MNDKIKGYKFKNFYLEVEDRDKLKFFVDDEETDKLNNKELEFLTTLFEKYPEVVNKNDFKEKFPDLASISDFIRHAKLKVNSVLKDKNQRIIQTIHGEGYKLVGNFETVYGEALEEVSDNPNLKSENTLDENRLNEEKKEIETSIKTPSVENKNLANENAKETLNDGDIVSEETNTFKRWIINDGRKITLIFTALIIFSFILSFLVCEIWSIDIDVSKGISISTSISTILIVLSAIIYNWLYPGIITFPENKWTKNSGLSISTLKQYRDDWIFLLFFWGALYGFVVYTLLNSDMLAIMVLLNNINTLLIFRCYNTLNKSNEIASSSHSNITFVTVLYVLAIIVIAIANNQMHEFNEVSKLLSGIFAGVVMALYFGRFQSKFLKSPQWLLNLLYFYVAIQPLFVYFDNTNYTKIIIPLALLLKCLLILYMFWLFDSGRLLFYMVRVRRTDDQVEKEFQKFLHDFIIEKN